VTYASDSVSLEAVQDLLEEFGQAQQLHSESKATAKAVYEEWWPPVEMESWWTF